MAAASPRVGPELRSRAGLAAVALRAARRARGLGGGSVSAGGVGAAAAGDLRGVARRARGGAAGPSPLGGPAERARGVRGAAGREAARAASAAGPMASGASAGGR